MIVSLSGTGFDDLQACADPGAPEHGYKTPSAGVFFESVVVRFHCQEGYRLNGTSKKLCVRHFNGSLSWKPSDKPVCLQEGKSVFFKLFTVSVFLTVHVPCLCVSGRNTTGWSPFHCVLLDIYFNFPSTILVCQLNLYHERLCVLKGA